MSSEGDSNFISPNSEELSRRNGSVDGQRHHVAFPHQQRARRRRERRKFRQHKVSISPTFYDQLFSYKCIFQAILYLQFGFVIFSQKNTGAKAACKMLVKLTKGLNN